MKWHLHHEIYGDKPWDVQAEAMRRSEGKPKYGYFLEQGLGKTPLSLNDFIDSGLDGCVVLAPNTFKTDWALAPEEWGHSYIFSGTSDQHSHPHNIGVTGEPWLYAVNYEAARAGRLKEMLVELFDKQRLMLVIDESTAIKNPQALTTKAVIELAKRAAIVRELNGTPLVQNVLDYWGQLRVLGELNGVNPYAFRNRFAVMGGYMGRQIKGMRNEEELYAILDRCSFRALKQDWRDLPPKIYMPPVHLDMTSRQRKHYHEMMEDFFTEIDGVQVTAAMVLTQLDKLRQISSCLLMQDEQVQWLAEPKDNPKVKALHDIVGDGSYGKTIVVHFYRPSGNMLIEETQRAGLDPAYIRGGMTPEDLRFQKDKFNKDPNCRILIAQEGATHLGHTLLGGKGKDRATRMCFYENSFSLKERLQMEDRNHRGEQDQDCLYFDLLTSPMDGVVVEALRRKKAMADAVDDIVKTVRSEAPVRGIARRA